MALNLLSGIQIDGNTAKKYCAKSKEEKVKFLMGACKVSKELAESFVEKPLTHADGKACCGNHSNHAKHHQPVSVPEETAEPATVGENKAKDNGADSKGRGAGSKKN